MPELESIETALTNEYPTLFSAEIRVEKRLPAGPDRPSNAYLVTSNGSHEIPTRFIAKRGHSAGGSSNGIAPEWQATKHAAQHGVPTPTVLLSDQAPKEFLLLEFLEGQDAQQAIDKGANPNDIFRAIAETLAKLHRVPTEGANWPDSIRTRFQSKMPAMETILGKEMAAHYLAHFTEAATALEEEPDEPKLIHRDVYLSNFMVTRPEPGAAIIDFGMACGGRPLYDLAKFYILDLYRYPEARDAFLGGYFSASTRPPAFSGLMRLYLYVELSGMIRFFEAIGQTQALQHATTVLGELLSDRGRMVDLLS